MLKFNVKEEHCLDVVDITPVLDMKTPILDLALGENDSVLAVTTEVKVAICQTREGNFVEVALDKNREGESFVGSVIHQGRH